MQLTTKGRYAVMAMADLAFQSEKSDNAPVSLAMISERQEISLAYLEQLFVKLRRAGIVNSTRGPGGGYRLARPSGDIKILEIISAVDEPVKIVRCDSGAETEKGCIGGERCLTHGLWASLGKHLVDFLKGVSLQDVISGSLDKAVVTNEPVYEVSL